LTDVGALADALAKAFRTQEHADVILTQIDFPAGRLPKFETALGFWTKIIQDLQAGVMVDGLLTLLARATKMMPGAADLRALHAELQAELGPAEPVAPAALPLTSDGKFPLMVMIGSEHHTQFLKLLQNTLGVDNVDLLYASQRQSAAQVPQQDDDGVELISRIAKPIRQECGDNVELQYEEAPDRPFLYRLLTVTAPDGTPYEMNLVPSTTLTEDIAEAIVRQRPEAMTDNRGRRVRTVVDLVIGERGETRRLERGQTLHEAGIQEGDRMQVGTQAIAGASPVLHTDAVYRARAQLKRYAMAHQDIDFKILEMDPPDVPIRYLIGFEVPGFGLPEDYEAQPLLPPVIGRHEAQIVLTRDFPVRAPLVVWHTPVFHPNIWQSIRTGALQGQACLGPLMDGWRPDMPFGLLCRLVVDIARYRNYDVTEATTFPDPIAARWARSPEGQAMIKSIGGKQIAEEPAIPDADAPVGSRVDALWIEETGRTR
jgi:hypothetical protein